MCQKLEGVIIEGDKVYIKAGCGSCTVIYNGVVRQVEELGLWIDEGEEDWDYIPYEGITEWAVE